MARRMNIQMETNMTFWLRLAGMEESKIEKLITLIDWELPRSNEQC